MAYPEVIIPPSVKPTSPYEPQLADDQTIAFSPRFGRGATQRQVWADPLWGWSLRYRALAGADRALVRSAILNARGKAANLRMTPGQPLRGSFPAYELLTNNDFSKGTTGWTGIRCTLTASDGVLRATNTKSAGATTFELYQSIPLTQYLPYVGRGFISSVSRLGMAGGVYLDASNYALNPQGLLSKAFVPNATGGVAFYPGVFDTSGVASIAGDYGDISYASVSRCALVDNGPNAFLQSSKADQSPWAYSNASGDDNGTASPDGTTTSQYVLENTANAPHYMYQDVVVSSAAGDYSASVYVVANLRTWGYIQLIELTGSTSVFAFVNFSTGAVGTTSTGANWSNLRIAVVSCGNGWFRITLTARKTNAATSVRFVLGGATADNVGTYVGSAASVAFLWWRASLAQSSIPVRSVETTTTATTGTAQSGGTIYVKGLPASTSWLLLAGDFFEINGELKQCTASLDSDAAGLGALQFRPGLWSSPADNDPVIILNPMGRFSLASNPRITDHYGLYTDVELELVEAGP